MAQRKGHEASPAGRQPDVFVTGVSNAAFQGSVDDVTDVNRNMTRISVISVSATDQHIVKKPKQRTSSEKDQGYAWVILVASVVSNIITSCGLSISGVLLLELKKTFVGSDVQLNIATTTQFALSLTPGMITGLVISRFGAKRVSMVGCLLSTASFFTTSFAPNITVFTATYLVSAIGTSCMQMSVTVLCAQYFDKHKALAYGLLAFGYSVSYFFWPPFSSVLFEYYGWRSGFMILAGIQLQGCIIAALMRPFKQDVGKASTSVRSHLLSQCQVFKNKQIMFFLVISFFAGLPYMFCPTYCPTIGKGLGATDTNAALLVSIQGVCSGISRITNGVIGDRGWMRNNRLLICVWGFFLAGIAKLSSAAVTSYLTAAIYAVADGFGGGSFTSVMFTIVTDMIPPQLAAFTTGLFVMAFGFTLLIGNVFSGWLYTVFGSLYEPAFILGSGQIFASILTACLYISTKWSDRNLFDLTRKAKQMSTDL